MLLSLRLSLHEPWSAQARRALVVLAALAAYQPAVSARAQSTWLPTSGTVPWTTGTAWSGGLIPNASGALAVFPTAAVGASVLSSTVTTGTVSFTAASGNLVLSGSNGVTNDVITLATASGSPTVNVNGSGQLYWYTDLAGTQGYTKTGPGTLIFRYNSDNLTYTGTITLGGGNVQINQDGSLGNVNNPILVSANSALQSISGNQLGTITLPSTRTITINNGITFTLQNSGTGNSTAVNGPITGAGNLTLVSNSFSLNGANTYAGNTIIRSATVTLGSSSPLSTGALTLQSAGNAATQLATLVDLGGQSQSVSSLTMTLGGTAQVTNTFRNGALTVAGGNLAVNSGAAGAGSGTTALDFRGLSSFVYSNASGTFGIGTTGTLASGTFATIVNTATANTITAAHVQIGNSANGPGVSQSTLGLGQTNTYNTGTLTVGAYRGNGTVAYQSGVTGGSLVLRGTAGGSSRIDNVYVGYKAGGDNFGNGVLDTAVGSIDVRANNFAIGTYIVNASNSQTGTFTMASGTVDTTTLSLGLVSVSSGSTGTPTITSVLNQNGGLVKASTVVFGSNGATLGTNSPTFASTYNLSSGTLAAAAIGVGTGTFNAASNRRIVWTGGVIQNYDSVTDLAITGTSGAGGSLTLALSGAGPRTFAPSVGRRITVGSSTVISGTGGFIVDGPGTVVLTGSTAYSGATAVNSGSLLVDTFLPSTSGVTVAAGATLGGSGTISSAVSMAGTLEPGAVGGFGTLTLGSLSLAGSASTLLAIGGTNRGASYDAIDVSQASALTYGGGLSLSFADVFADNTSFGLFGINGTPSGSYASVTASGSYGLLTFTNAGGVWSASASNGQTLTFAESTGMLSIVPEPTLVLSGVMTAGLAALVMARRRASH
jgi:autotransporter-associated beta strand protein